MRLTVAGVTHRGAVRRHNEDTVCLAGLLSSAEDGAPVGLEVETRGRAVLLAVADGLGGHAAGDRASRLVLASLAARSDHLRDGGRLTAAIDEADRAVHEEMTYHPAWQGMGTTLAGFAVHGDTALCFNVGDSRCYASRSDSLLQLSTDDSPSPFAGQPAGMTSNIVTQTLGGTTARTRLDPHVHPLVLEPATRLLVCSDGLTDYVHLDDIEREVLSRSSPVRVVEVLLRLALVAGAPDNVSVVLAEAHPDTLVQSSAATPAEGSDR